MNNGHSRRGFLKRLAVGAGALGASSLPGINLLGGKAEAAGEAEAPALFILNLIGGYNALFGSAGSFTGSGSFGCATGNVKKVGTSNLIVDNRTLGSLSATTLNKMASIGVNHGITSHPSARMAHMFESDKSRLIKMSTALGGTAAVRCVNMGSVMPVGTHRAVGDVSLQQVRDLSTTIAVLGGAATANAPTRDMASKGLAAAAAMSKASLDANPSSAKSLIEGYPAASAQLAQDVVALNYAGMANGYGLTAGTNGSFATEVRGTTMQIMGAELMIRAGANLVIANQGGWDTHGDNDGSEVRNKLINDGTMAALKAFTDRTLAMTNRNVVTVIIGDFARSLPGSNHQSNLTATVIGKYVKLGTTGRVDADVGLPSGSPGIQGLWAYLAAVLKLPTAPFGANPHALVL